MRKASLWQRLFDLERAVVEDVEFDPGQVVVVHARPVARARRRCGCCGARCPRFDRGSGRRRWRALDLGTVQAFIEADAPRVRCPRHGVIVAAVPWARHGAGHTRAFDDTVAWLACHTSKSAVRALMRIAWPTVGAIITRVSADIDARTDRLDGLRRIGIDEISYRRGQLFLTAVVDHDTRRLVWLGEGRTKATLHAFFDQLGDERSARITEVTADAAHYIAAVVADRAPQAVRCADPFHVVQWATHELDLVRRRIWNQARNAPGGRGRPREGRSQESAGDARTLQRSRYTLWKNPEDLTGRQQAKLDWIATAAPELHRAYLLKEGLRSVFAVGGTEGIEGLTRWLSWAQRCRIEEFVRLGRKVRRQLDPIHASLRLGLSNALLEATNTKIRLLTRIAYGFRTPRSLMALAMLALGGHRPDLPGR
ncbi:ISL3 family transposase [Amycolatopsis eburnea]|uniref:ISL3 family transposase n=1 Tax=Amycolatopsis eburnea TaxID=2267691 RepID=A0A427SVD2_9PSEU|nr:ISL3 family transposase [Amycolatopsis eburnea]RSD08009.1 ISL3 family transposase [Amycolatopsis eburnea]